MPSEFTRGELGHLRHPWKREIGDWGGCRNLNTNHGWVIGNPSQDVTVTFNWRSLFSQRIYGKLKKQVPTTEIWRQSSTEIGPSFQLPALGKAFTMASPQQR